MPIEWITIIFLTVAAAGLISAIVFRERDNKEKIEYLEEDCNRLCDKLDEVENKNMELIVKYSASLDEHNKALDDISNKYKKLELELEKKDLEIERLSHINEVFNQLANVEEGSTNEKEEAKKED